jgi:hypothetical protein
LPERTLLETKLEKLGYQTRFDGWKVEVLMNGHWEAFQCLRKEANDPESVRKRLHRLGIA